MFKRCFILLVFMLSQCMCAQHKNSYVFFEVNESTHVKFLSKKRKSFKEVKSIEKNIFMFDNRNIFFVEVEKRLIRMDLRKYKENKFFNVKINIKENSEGVIYNYKRGDAIRIEGDCHNKTCDIIVIEFPQIIVIDNQYHTTINNVFSKYIFE